MEKILGLSSFQRKGRLDVLLLLIRDGPFSPKSFCHSPLPQVVANGCFIKPLPLVEKLGDVITGVFQERAVDQEANPLGEKITTHNSG